MKSSLNLNKKLNIVSFDVPYPPNYGGVIDVFYKLKALKDLNISIILHTFEYGRGMQPHLEKYCDEVHYYKRQLKIINVFSNVPYIVKSRENKTLIQNLKENNYPILFEGLHTTFPLLKSDFKDRITLLRAHNIEHKYYYGLAKSESNVLKKIFFKFEGKKLENFQSILQKVNYILSISPIEQIYFSKRFSKKAIYVPVFHENFKITSKLGNGNFALYHGDLRISDNLKACEFLIDIFSKTNFPLILASSFKNKNVLTKIKNYKNVSFIEINSHSKLESLIEAAHINVLPTFQNTGIKLKLINSLFKGRFIVANNNMIKKTGLEKLCYVANSKKEFRNIVAILFKMKFSSAEIQKRKTGLNCFNNSKNAEKIYNLI